jgi:hypothetical protein
MKALSIRRAPRARGPQPDPASAALDASFGGLSELHAPERENEDPALSAMPTLGELIGSDDDEGPPDGFDLGSVMESAVSANVTELPAPEGDVSDLALDGDLQVQDNVGGPEQVQVALDEVPVENIPEISGPTPNIEGPTETTAPQIAPPTSDAPSPDVRAAYEAFANEGLELSSKITDRYSQIRDDVTGVAGGAIAEVQGAANALRDHASGKIDAARAQVSGLAEGARARATTAHDTRLEELRTANASALQRVLETSTAHQDAITCKVDELASAARALGQSASSEILATAQEQAQSVRDHAAGVVGRYADHKYARDIRVTCNRMASESAAKLLEEGQKAADSVREAADGLAAKIEADGQQYIANLAENDEPTRELFDSLLTEAQDTLGGGLEETLAEIERTEQALVAQLDGMAGGFMASIAQAETTQVEAIVRQRDTILDALGEARTSALMAIEDKLCEVEAWVDDNDEAPPELVIAHLQEMGIEFASAIDDLDLELLIMGVQAVDTLSAAKVSALGAFDSTRADIDGKVDEAVQGGAESLEAIVAGYDEGLAEQVADFEQAWNDEADQKIQELDAARDDAIAGLDSTWSQGESEICQQAESAKGGLRTAGSDSRRDIGAKADELASRKWWQVVGGLLGSFFKGMLSGLLSVLKGIGIALLVVAAIILVVALVIVIVKGAAIGAAIAAAAALVVAAAKALAVVGVVLAALSTLNSVIKLAAAWMNPDMTWNEVAEQGGDSFVSILGDWVPGIALGKVKNPGKIVSVASDVNDMVSVFGNVPVVMTGASEAGQATRASSDARSR